MRTRLFSFLALCLLAGAVSQAQIINITLTGDDTGYYYGDKYGLDAWQYSFTSGGDVNGHVFVRRGYWVYGASSSNLWASSDAYLQIDLSALGVLTAADIISATFHFKVDTINTSAVTFLKHVTTQSTLATGNSSQMLVGDANVSSLSSATLTTGWNAIDATYFIQSDLENGYSFAAFSIPQFGQGYDEDRLLTFFGATATNPGDRPYLTVTTAVPEPATFALIASGAVLALALFRRRRR